MNTTEQTFKHIYKQQLNKHSLETCNKQTWTKQSLTGSGKYLQILLEWQMQQVYPLQF